jgi:hypothetical protein
MADEQKQEHIPGRDCWCKPYVLMAGSKVLTEYAGRVVETTPLDADRVAVHIEPHEEAS